MITWTRSANINHGKHLAAVAWAHKVSAYVNDNFGTNITVNGNVAGPVNQLHWIGSFASLAEFEAITSQIVRDTEYNQLLEESSAANLFATPSFEDTLYYSLD
jgi:hypothetical protein